VRWSRACDQANCAAQDGISPLSLGYQLAGDNNAVLGGW
jgi:hypothetical protein